MNVKTITIIVQHKLTIAEIEVEGIGTVKIENCISQETVNKLQEEVIAVLRSKMGQTL